VPAASLPPSVLSENGYSLPMAILMERVAAPHRNLVLPGPFFKPVVGLHLGNLRPSISAQYSAQNRAYQPLSLLP
jgi:hypothetical protein